MNNFYICIYFSLLLSDGNNIIKNKILKQVENRIENLLECVVKSNN
jgi:hypothetical protein